VPYQPIPSDFALKPRRPRSSWRNPAVAWSLVFSAVLGGAVFASAPPQLSGALPPSASTPSTQVVSQVVQAQLQALATQDANKAFALADQDLRTQFGTADAFLATVREQYPMLLHPASVLFLKPETEGSIALQKVRLSDQDGSAWTVTYLLNRQQDNQWRISGCVISSHGRQVLT
jgi:hypothetical protein